MIRAARFALALALSACAGPAPTVHPVHPGQAARAEDREALARQGIRAIDEGRHDEAIQIFDRLLAGDPGNLDYAYEKAFAYYGKKDYDAAVALLEPLREGESSPRVFQLLGNAYDLRGEAPRAVATYEEGQRRFPAAGFLHYDHGVCLLGGEDVAGALTQFLRAIDKDPRHVGSHAMIARIIADHDPVFGILHAETAMALEPGSERTLEMSQLVARLYARMIHEALAGPSVSRSESSFVNLFRATLKAVVDAGEVKRYALDDVARLRAAMLSGWVNAEETFEVPPLVGWQVQVAAAGHLEAYNRWVLGVGNDGYRAWCEAGHGEACQAFVAWFEVTDYDPAAFGPG